MENKIIKLQNIIKIHINRIEHMKDKYDILLKKYEKLELRVSKIENDNRIKNDKNKF